MRHASRVKTVSAVLVVGSALALLSSTPSAQSSRAIELSLAHFAANRALYGIANPSADLHARSIRADASGVTHVRFDQSYRGLKVFEGEAIAHVSADGDVTVTNALRGNLAVDASARSGRNAQARNRADESERRNAA